MTDYRAQENVLRSVLAELAFDSVVEIGARGRIEPIIRESHPDVDYRAVELGASRPASPAADLVIAVEYLMHLPPEETETTIRRMLRLSQSHIITLDWTVPLPRRVPIPGNHLHDYQALLGTTSLPASKWPAPRRVEAIKAGPLQSLHWIKRP